MCCKCSKTLKHLQLSLDISAHEEFIITLFSGKPHAVHYLKIQTFSQASTLLINCILIKYSFVEFYKWIGIVWATLQDKNWSCETVNKQTFGCTKFKFNIKGVLQVQNNSAVSTISVVWSWSPKTLNCTFKLAKIFNIQTHTRFSVNLLIANWLNYISRGRQQVESFLQ